MERTSGMLINKVREMRARHRWSQQDLAKKNWDHKTKDWIN